MVNRITGQICCLVSAPETVSKTLPNFLLLLLRVVMHDRVGSHSTVATLGSGHMGIYRAGCELVASSASS